MSIIPYVRTIVLYVLAGLAEIGGGAGPAMVA
jgi:drug/metabolite transporter superfamily protein YnfA